MSHTDRLEAAPIEPQDSLDVLDNDERLTDEQPPLDAIDAVISNSDRHGQTDTHTDLQSIFPSASVSLSASMRMTAGRAAC